MSPPTTGSGRAIPKEILRTNVDGTRSVMEAALAPASSASSTPAASRPSSWRAPTAPVDETAPLAGTKRSAPTSAARSLAERLVEAMVARDGLPAVIVNPSTPIGPRDVKPTPTGRIIVEAARGRMPAFVDTGLNLVHVDDVAAGPSARARARPDRRALYPRRRERACCATCWRHRRRCRPQARRRIRLPRAPLFPLAYGARGICAASPARSRS